MLKNMGEMNLIIIYIKVPNLKGFNKKVIDRSQQAGAADYLFFVLNCKNMAFYSNRNYPSRCPFWTTK